MDFSVFPNQMFPPGEPIAADNSIEATDTEEFFRSRYRNEITFKVLKSHYRHDPAACITFMQPKAFAFYFPVYLRIALEEYEICDAISGSIIFDLLRMAQGEYEDQLNAILSSYSSEQLAAIAEFLGEMSDKYWHRYPHDDAKNALNLYWGRFSKRSPDAA